MLVIDALPPTTAQAGHDIGRGRSCANYVYLDFAQMYNSNTILDINLL